MTPSEIVLARSNDLPFSEGDLLEVIDRCSVFERRPGWFVRVERADGDRLAMAPLGDPPRDDLIDPMVRRWDAEPHPVRPGDGAIALGDGVEVKFEGSRFRSGDYWLIAARMADASLTWPDATPAADPQPPHGIEVHRCPLAAVRRDDAGWTVLRDLRVLVR